MYLISFNYIYSIYVCVYIYIYIYIYIWYNFSCVSLNLELILTSLFLLNSKQEKWACIDNRSYFMPITDNLVCFFLIWRKILTASWWVNKRKPFFLLLRATFRVLNIVLTGKEPRLYLRKTYLEAGKVTQRCLMFLMRDITYCDFSCTLWYPQINKVLSR